MSRTFGSMYPNTYSSDYINNLSMKCSKKCAINNCPLDDDSIYLKITDAALTYLTINDAALTYLTRIDAESLFLGRTGTPTSVATATTFTGTLSAITPLTLSGYKLYGDSNQSVGFSSNLNTANRLRLVSIGHSSQGTDDCTAVGYAANGSGSGATAIGRGAVGGGYLSTAIGNSSSAGGSGSTAIGSGAIATLSNQIMLGTPTETVY